MRCGHRKKGFSEKFRGLAFRIGCHRQLWKDEPIAWPQSLCRYFEPGEFPAPNLRKAKCWCGRRNLFSGPAQRGAFARQKIRQRALGLVELEALERKSKAGTSALVLRSRATYNLRWGWSWKLPAVRWGRERFSGIDHAPVYHELLYPWKRGRNVQALVNVVSPVLHC